QSTINNQLQDGVNERLFPTSRGFCTKRKRSAFYFLGLGFSEVQNR
ncbi:MAG: hypothetical protein ACI97A_004208, partial [Planctomycetota bacterium]